MSDPEFFEQTVSDFLFGPCSKQVLYELVSDGSEYWDKVENFILDNENVKLKALSFAQRSWILKIKDGLLEKA
jgi:hypothetical protein